MTSADPNARRTVAVLVVNYFSAAETARLAHSIAANDGAEAVHLSIVDNSTDDAEHRVLVRTLTPLRPQLLSLTITAAESNLGYARGNNTGWEALPERPDVVLVANPDVTIAQGSLAVLAEAVSASRSVWSSPTVTDESLLSGQGVMNPWTSRTRQLKASEHSAHITYPGGHFLALPSALWEQLGGFSTRFFLYCEEIDLMMRSTSFGGSVEQLDEFLVRHEGAATTSDGHVLSLFATYHATRSRVILYRTQPALRRFLAPMLAARLLYAARQCVMRDWMRGHATMRGIIDGLRHAETGGAHG